jgi:hypothetical protein
MSESLQKRRRITHERNLLWSEKKDAALQLKRTQSLPYLAVVSALGVPGIGELVAEYATNSTTTVFLSGLGMEVVRMGERHIATLVHALLATITSQDARCDLPVFRFTCNGSDIAEMLQLNPCLNLGDISNDASVTEFTRHVRHHK